MVVVHFLPAEAGDCSVIEFDNNECIIVDCGYKSTYHKELKPLLQKLKLKGCRVVLLIVTHIDQDHIEGAIELIKENGNVNDPQIIDIDNIWFNGFFNTLFLNEVFEQHRFNLEQELQNSKMRIVKSQLEMQNCSSESTISVKQSKSFEELCSLNDYRLNMQFEDRIVKRNFEHKEDINNSKINFDDFSITVLSPNQTLLNGLANEFNKEMIKNFGVDYYINNDSDFSTIFELIMKLYIEPVDHSEFISASEDDISKWLGTSIMSRMNVVNKSAIVVEIEYKGYKLLFTGDSDSDYWAEFASDSYDVLKASHHGTMKPNQQLIKRVKAKHTLISTNGNKHGHPEKELLANIILNGNKRLYFNYDTGYKSILSNIKEKYNFKPYFCEKKIVLK